jgi:hypothetical protein
LKFHNNRRRRENNPLSFFALKVAKRKQTSPLLFNLIQTKLAKKSLYLAAIIFFACFPFFHFSLTESFQTSFVFLRESFK